MPPVAANAVQVGEIPVLTPLTAFSFGAPGGLHTTAERSADGSNMVVLPLAGHDICEGVPSFSPDGKRLFYEAFDGHVEAVWL